MSTQPTLFPFDVQTAAQISACGTYRYWLSRVWDNTLPAVTFIMLNPSTADDTKDDPTIRRCIRYARDWGCGALYVGNLFALRSTDPAALRLHYPVKPKLDESEKTAILTVTEGRRIIAAWGAEGRLLNRHTEILALLKAHGRVVECMGTTKDGYPRHPLYVRADVKPVPYVMEGGLAE